MAIIKLLTAGLLIAASPLAATSADINEIVNGSYTGLMIAACCGELSLVETFLASGADTNITNQYGDTALMMAIYQRKTAVAQKLIESGADTFIVNKAGDDALKLALTERLPHIVELIESHRAGIAGEKPKMWSGTRAMVEAEIAKKTGMTFAEVLAADRAMSKAREKAMEEAARMATRAEETAKID